MRLGLFSGTPSTILLGKTQDDERAVIAEDELISRERLVNLLRSETEIEIVAACHNGVDTYQTSEAQEARLAFSGRRDAGN